MLIGGTLVFSCSLCKELGESVLRVEGGRKYLGYVACMTPRRRWVRRFLGSTAAFNGGAELAQLVCVQFDNGEAVFLLVGG